jgi:hypothetical protein
MATLDEVGVVLGQLGAIYGKDVGEHTAKAWHPILADIPARRLFDAAAQHARSSRFFPAPSELVSLATRHAATPSPEDAWRLVKREIRRVGYYGEPSFPDTTTASAVEAMGWDTLCLMDAGDQAAERAHFMRIYGAYRERFRMAANPRLRGLIQGLLEQDDD